MYKVTTKLDNQVISKYFDDKDCAQQYYIMCEESNLFGYVEYEDLDCMKEDKNVKGSISSSDR